MRALEQQHYLFVRSLSQKRKPIARSQALSISKRYVQHGERFDVSGALERTGIDHIEPHLGNEFLDLFLGPCVVACNKYRDGFALNLWVLRRIDLRKDGV